VDQGVDDVLEHHAIRDPATVAAERVIRVVLRPVAADRGLEFGPDRFEQA
jgi:hypothetical protein